MTQPVMVVIQARLASTRLPAKALLPIGGMPSVALCARRAANGGLPVIIATSTDEIDDALVECLAQYQIPIFRGSQHDVLARFVGATTTLPDDGIVVRLTADNVFPDGAFIEELLDAFIRSDVEYLGTASPQDGLPYGLSAEVFSLAVLRRAHAQATAPTDREHVTPWIRRHARAVRHVSTYVDANWSRLRCTLDTFDDYEALLRVFRGVEMPVSVSWRRLVGRLADSTPNGREPRCPFGVDRAGNARSVLTLGTAQVGMRYGIANRLGRPDDEKTAALLEQALDSGITAIDTARAYGDSEDRIGKLLSGRNRSRVEIITKLDVLGHLAECATADAVRSAVEASVFRSTHALRTQRIDVLLLHRWQHRRAWQGAAWETLLALRDHGVIGCLGASVSDPTEAIEALEDADVRHLQCPVNLLDARWHAPAFRRAVDARKDVLVHARSTLLQGLLSLPANEWIRVDGVDARALCATIDHWVAALNRTDRIDLCMAYVRGLPWVTSLVVGMEDAAQLRANLGYMQRPALSPAEIARVNASLPDLPEAFLNPARWSNPDG
ncbi:MAG: aldo/keto reductase [Caldimonas sp.]